MSAPPPKGPPGGAPEDRPPPAAPPPGAPAPRFGAPHDASVPRMETVRVTAPDLARRAALEKTRSRLVITAFCFALLFLAIAGKLALATIITPLTPHLPALASRPSEVPPAEPASDQQPLAPPAPPGHEQRAMITDRNGEILAISLPTAGLYADPREMIDPSDSAHKLKLALPRLDEAAVRERLSSEKQFVYLARQITPREQLAINQLGIPGVYFQPTARRRYPQGRAAAQVLGGVDVDGHGIAGVERFFDQRLREDPEPLRLSLDLRIQQVVHEELTRAIEDFNGIGGCGLVMDVRTGEVLAMVSLPDYDANEAGQATQEQRFNRAVTGMYEPGSTFKLQTVSMALDSGAVNIWNGFDASHPISIGRFTISDFEGKKRFLYVPEIIAYSSNIGAAHMAVAAGTDRQREWMAKMGMLSRIGIELPEVGSPLAPPASNWKEIATMTIAFGHGIAVSPLHVVVGTAAVANGGVRFRPTILAAEPDAKPREGTRVMQQTTSDTVRKLMRLVVTDGFGKNAEVPGYYVGGKTGTAEKSTRHGYNHNSRVDAFTSVFPMNAPRYAVYLMVDEPKANASSHGYATAGWVVAPSVGKVIARIGPMLGLLPDTEHAEEIHQALYIPLQPGKPAGSHPAPVAAAVARPDLTHPGSPPTGHLPAWPPQQEAAPRPSQPHDAAQPHDPRHEAQTAMPVAALADR